ncbi:hypothetical protein KC19_4G269200 [Ceratodon purpureus]|uniref:Translocation and assembly module TamB C-terminal domain-containing protein n=1 Tax=Ceratodon purpureus TaxID=3225 RepID=A0A8T0IGR6_CERPU|nr:hypothetical protein KC19_4G269200 [Ceratodon purpureus]
MMLARLHSLSSASTLPRLPLLSSPPFHPSRRPLSLRPVCASNPNPSFDSGSTWWRQQRPTASSLPLVLQRLHAHHHRGRFLKAASWLAAMLLLVASARYAQLRAQLYMDHHILPPLATILSTHLGRDVELGKVERLSLLSVSLGPSSVGPHAEEFSCGGIPAIQIYVRPLKSLQRGQVVLDAVLRNPHVLVAQKRDWSWLGIPAVSEKKINSNRQSSEVGLDDRTKVRRAAREEMALRMDKERDSAARQACKSGYRMGGLVESINSKVKDAVGNGKPGSIEGAIESTPADSDVDDEGFNAEEQEGSGKAGRSRNTDTVSGFHEDDFEEPTLAKDMDRQVWRAKAWTEKHLLRPVMRKLLKRRSQRRGSVLTKSEYQSWNLQRSAVAARCMFERIDRDKRRKLLSLRNSGLRGQGGGLKPEPEKAASSLSQVEKYQLNPNNKDIGDGSAAGVANQHAFPSRQGMNVQTPRVDQTSLKGTGVGSFDELWDLGSTRNERSLTMKVKGFANRLVRQAKRRVDVSRANGWTPIALNSVYFRDGTLSLLGYGDEEARVMEKVKGSVKLSGNHQQILVQVTGRPNEWRTMKTGNGGRLLVKVAVDLAQQSWDVRVKCCNVFAPLFERLLELPLEWSNGRASGEVQIWMKKEETFPNFGGRIDVKGLDFHIADAPAFFTGVGGTLFFQGQRLFFHNATGKYGSIPLTISGDMDINPDDGEYRLSCQVAGVESNSLMRSLGAQPPPLSLAGSLKGVVYCRGPLDSPIFEGSVETTGRNMTLTYDTASSAATDAVRKNIEKGAVAAYDRVPFVSASTSFTFNTDNGMADLYGLKACPVGGGEIRGAGSLWICPEGEMDPSAVNVDCFGSVAGDALAGFYAPAGVEVPHSSFGVTQLEAKIRGALLMPVFDIKWATPEAQGAFCEGHGDVHISREAIILHSLASSFNLTTKVHTSYPPIVQKRGPRIPQFKPPTMPKVTGLDVDMRLNGFDLMDVHPLCFGENFSPPQSMHMKVFGKVKFNGRVPAIKTASQVSLEAESPPERKLTSMIGEVSLVGLKLNQFMVAPNLTGSLDISPTYLKLDTSGRIDEHLHVHVFDMNEDGTISADGQVLPSLFGESSRKGLSFSLERGHLRTNLQYRPGHSAKLEVRNLQLDELELASLRGAVHKADMSLNLLRRRGQGSLDVKQPRFSGLQGESLDVAARWSGDVVTLEKSILEQANSKYELQGEYVLRGQRAGEKERDEEVMLEKAMAGQLGTFITSMGRWRLRLEVPQAEVSEMLPVARLLSRSSDPAVVSRSKEMFLHGVQSAGFSAENAKELLEYIRSTKPGDPEDESEPEALPLPGLAELKGKWKGTLEATGGGKGDTTADFDLRGEDWEWGAYRTQRVIAVGDFTNNDGLRLERFFIQKDTATLHADGTVLGAKPNLHFAVLNFPVNLVHPLLHAIQSSSQKPLPSSSVSSPPPLKGTLYMEGDLRGHMIKPQCDVQIRLLDGAIGGVSLGRAEVAASITSANRLAFNAVFEPMTHAGHVRVRGSLPMGPGESLDELREELDEEQGREREKHRRVRGRVWERSRERDDEGDDNIASDVQDKSGGGEEGWEVRLAESLKPLDKDFVDSGAVQVDVTVKDGGMMLLTAFTPGLQWIQGNADVTAQIRGTVLQPIADGVAKFHKVSVSSPVLPRPFSNLGGTICVKNNQVCVEGLEGRVGRRGRLEVKGQLPIKAHESYSNGEAIEIKAENLEVRARHTFSGQVDSNMRLMGSLLEPEVTGLVKLSHGEAYLSQEKGLEKVPSPSPSTSSSDSPRGSYSLMAAAGNIARKQTSEMLPLPDKLIKKISEDLSSNEAKDQKSQPPIAVRLRGLKLQLGPELRMVYPLILNFAVNGELELNGFADSSRLKPKGALTFENGDVNLVATQVRLNRDHPNRAKFEPDQGFDPSLDLALVGADWQIKVQGLASNWQDNLVVTSNRTGEQDALTLIEAARVFESQLADSLLEGDGQLAFKKLAAATVETLMPKIETKGEFGQARWRLVSAPQVPNLLSLDPTTDPFKSLANLSFGAEVEVQLGKHLQASVVRQLKESEMATQWTLLYQLNSKLRILFSSIPSVDNRLLIEYSATSQS